MALWSVSADPARLNESGRNTMTEHLGIEFIAIGDDFLQARMPVDRRTVQPYGLLHGGASAALAETLGSVASTLVVDRARQRVAGLEINANHVRSVREGWVTGTCRPLHVGRGTHVWDIRIEDGDGRLVCVSRLTVAILDTP